ncbi:MAG: L-2-amino-thiazoline-4-carboxylic acid hydrolase [Clostridia bacterium]|nr:L-2-amino-thiazoline-4-carboxylic acid hydrolase [Clostridia bacterium]
MGKLDRSFIYKKFKRTLTRALGREQADVIWAEANAELALLLRQYGAVSADERMMVLPLHALYAAMKQHGITNALDLLKAYGEQTGAELSAMIRRITAIPGLPHLLWRHMPALMRMTSSPKKGYQRRIVSETSELVGVDILVCPLHELTKRLGVPEIAPIICLIDKGQMTGFRRIDYTRTMALGDGDAYCDYRLRYNKDKP